MPPGGGHLALEPFDGFVRTLAIERFAGALVRDCQKLEELRIVVEHFLEVRHQPALVDRVAREAAAEMVVDAALADMVEGDLDRGEITSLPPRLVRCPARHSSSNSAACGNFGAPRVPPLLDR